MIPGVRAQLSVAALSFLCLVTGVGVTAQGQPPRQTERVEVPPPPFTEGIFPCSACHAGMKVNRTRRPLTEMHTDIVLKHGAEGRWCLDCHDAQNRDMLHLAGGELVPFDESYRLCGQCHGEKYRDWRAGVHGRRTGYWNGHKTYLLCANCHNPHEPRFKPIAPKPAPVPPTGLRK
jgi:formate-dependent nitrite reductase cytochrome c552 subunit